MAWANKYSFNIVSIMAEIILSAVIELCADFERSFHLKPSWWRDLIKNESVYHGFQIIFIWLCLPDETLKIQRLSNTQMILEIANIQEYVR